jgi:hypothetical protein
MPLRYDEWVSVLKGAGVTYQQIADRMNRSDRFVRDIKNGKQPKYPETWEREIGAIAAQVISLPWPIDAQNQAIAIMNMYRSKKFAELDRLFGFSSRVMLNELQGYDPDAMQASEMLWGKTLVLFYYLFAMRSANISGLPDKFVDHEWEHVVLLLVALLDKEAGASWATILRWKVDQLRLAAKWNDLDARGDKRSSEEMRRWLEETKIRSTLIAYSDLVPHVLEAPFAALAIASRFRERGTYNDLLHRLRFIDGRFFTVDGLEDLKSDEHVDEDFDDFFEWAQSNLHLFNREEVA